MDKKIIPNSTQVHNAIFDILMSYLTEAELKCYLYVVRRTFGFHKKKDRISLGQFVKGLRDKDGRVVDLGTGLSRQAVVDALSALSEAGFIKKKTTIKGVEYSIDLDVDIAKALEKLLTYREKIKLAKKEKPKQKALIKINKKYKKKTKQAGADVVRVWDKLTLSPEKIEQIKAKLNEFRSSFGRVD